MTSGGWLGVALRRATNDAALVAASALVVVVASAVLVAAATYPDAIVRAGITRTLQAADPVASGISVSLDVRQADLADVDAGIHQVLDGALGSTTGPIALTGLSEAYGFGDSDPEAPAVRFAFADGLDGHASLVRGRWPATAAAGTGLDVDAAISEPAARTLGIDAGGVLQVTSRLDPRKRFTVHIVGIFAVNDPADALWGGEELVLRGTEQRGPFLTEGPLYIGRDVLLGQTVVGRATLTWRVVPAFDRFTPDNLATVGASVAALPDRLAGRLGRSQAIVVRTDLPQLLGAIDGRLAQADAGSTLVAGQIVVLALFALLFVAGLVVGQRRVATGLLRARGAGARHLMTLAIIEAGVIAIPSAAVGLPFGLALAGALAGFGPTVAGTTGGAGTVAGAAAASAQAVVRLTGPVIGLAAVVALVAIVGLVLPTALAVGPLAGVHRSQGRQRAAALLQRSRLDLAVAALAIVGLWRLRSSGDADIAGGVAPLATAGPAIGLLAGAILLLRVVPVAGSALEWLLVRARGRAGALTVRGVTRRAVAHGRPALLFAMSVAIGLFALGYSRTWERSERDQVALAVGAGVRGELGAGAHPSEPTTLATYLAVPGVTAATAVAHEDFAAGPGLAHGMLLGIVPDHMTAIAAFRPDLASRPFGDLMAGLVAARPDLPVIALPPGARRIRVRVDLRLAPTGTAPNLPVGWAGLSVELVVRDADGLLQRVPTGPDSGTPDDPYVATLAAVPDASARPAGIVAVEMRLALPGSQALVGTAGIRSIETSAGSSGDGDWAAVAGSAGGQGGLADWQVIRSAFDVPPTPLPPAPVTAGGDLIDATIAADSALTGPGTTTLTARPTAVTALAGGDLAGFVDPALLAATGNAEGDVVLVRHASSVTRRIRATEVVTAFPSLSADGFAVVDLPSLQLLQYASDGTFPEPDEWWLSVADGSDRAVISALAVGTAPLQDLRSTALETRARLADPIALAISGMLLLAALAGAAFAGIGFAAAAWASTRSRLEEFAVGRALGLTRGELARWLLLEQAFPAVIGIGWGIGLGLVLEWLVLPAVTLAPGGGPAAPPVLVSVPLDLVAGVAVAGAALIVVACLLALRTVERAGLTDALRGES